MLSRFYLVLGYGTLFVAAYLVLASIASGMMSAEYRQYLPPFGSESGLSPVIVLVVATWTSLLAIGCLSAASRTSETTNTAGAVPFILVLAIAWLGYLAPIAWNALMGP